MKNLFAVVLSVLFFLPAVSGQNITSPLDVKKQTEQLFAKGKVPPFSFVYGGKKSSDFIKSWDYRAEKLPADEPQTEKFLYTYSDKRTGLTVKCTVTCFTDFPATEWVLNFYNSSTKNTPLIEQIEVINQSFAASEKGTFILHHARGSGVAKSDFQPIDEELQSGKTVNIVQTAGRSSDYAALPFFNIEMPGSQGIVAAIGWTGSWFADVLQSGEKTVALKSGMGQIRTTLYPKEDMRTPKICLLFWNGDDRMAGHNMFRQFIFAHHTRKINGKPAEYPLSGSFDYGDPAPCGEYECLTESFAVALVKRYQQFDIVPEVFWLDAGWYTLDIEDGTWLHNVGNWSVDKKRFPNGLRPVADAVHATGAKFMVWFEPERIRRISEMGREHPEWLLQLPGKESRVFNLGNAEARNYLTEYVTGFLKREGVDYYRQDCNVDPLLFWNANDRPDRIGMTQIKHIEGLYAFWDSLLVRFPNLLIDNCASGGRRIDLETVSRSAPLWRSDYSYNEPEGKQCHTYGLNFYVPVHGTSVIKTDDYTFRSGLNATLALSWEITGKDSEPVPAIQKRIKDYQELRPYYYSDYYPLTPAATYLRDDAWLAYQMNRPQQHDGIILAFRRAESPDSSIRIKPSGLEKDTLYELFYEDYGLRIQKTGAEMMSGFDISIPAQRTSLMIRYKKTN